MLESLIDDTSCSLLSSRQEELTAVQEAGENPTTLQSRTRIKHNG